MPESIRTGALEALAVLCRDHGRALVSSLQDVFSVAAKHITRYCQYDAFIAIGLLPPNARTFKYIASALHGQILQWTGTAAVVPLL